MQELTRSAKAEKLGIDNTPPPLIKVRLKALINNILDPVREMWGKAIIVNSGFRCPQLNKALGGATNSQHMSGEAADITTGTISGNKLLFKMIQESDLPFDQLIDEKNYQWIHISYGPRNRRQVLHL